MSNEPTFNRWTAKCNAAVALDIPKDEATVTEVAREHDLAVLEIQAWVDEP